LLEGVVLPPLLEGVGAAMGGLTGAGVRQSTRRLFPPFPPFPSFALSFEVLPPLPPSPEVRSAPMGALVGKQSCSGSDGWVVGTKEGGIVGGLDSTSTGDWLGA